MSYPFRTVLLLLMLCLHLMFAFCYFQYLSLSPHPPTHSLKFVVQRKWGRGVSNTSRYWPHIYINIYAIYIFRCLFYKPIVTKLVISNCVKVRCWQKNTGHRQQILLVVIHSSFFGVQPDTVCTVAGVNWQLCLIVLFTFRAFKFDARVHIK